MDKRDILAFRTKGYLSYPKILQIEITTKCPLKCPQCYKDIDNLYDMDYELLKGIIQDGAENGLKSVMINGGEPLLHKNFIEFVTLLKELGIKSNCFTSGLGINQSFVEKIKGLDLLLNVSLNGSTLEINSLSRDGFVHAINAIKVLKENNMSYGINWVARHDNIKDFSNIVKLAEDNNASNVLIVGNKLNHNGVLESPLTKEDYACLIRYIKQYEQDINKVPLLRQMCFTALCYEYNPSYNNPLNSGCLAGKIFCAIDVNGDYMPCTHLHYKEKCSSVSDYWENSVVLKQLREIKPYEMEYCKDCSNSKTCSFCRAVSKESHDNFSIGLKTCVSKKIRV